MSEYRTSSTTTVVSLRLPNAAYQELCRRAANKGMLVSEFVRSRVNRELIRSHHKKE